MNLSIPDSFPLPGIVSALADDDAMFEGQGEHYLSVGLSAARLIQGALHEQPAPKRILDLPCGHGRVTRMLRACYPVAQVTVCDLDRSGVDFCASQFAARGVYSHEDFRLLELGERYDLIWVGSLITHLPEQHTRRFLDFAVRHLTPQGTLVVTSHGACVAQRLLSSNYGLTDAAARGLLADARTNGYGYRSYPGGEAYGLSLVRRAWFERLFAQAPLRLAAYQEQGWDDHQDVLVLRAPQAQAAPPGTMLSRLRPRAAPKPRPLFDRPGTATMPAAAQQAAMDDVTVSGFDEAWYVASDPLVAAAVVDGIFASGFDHYCRYGWREARAIGAPETEYDAVLRPARDR